MKSSLFLPLVLAIIVLGVLFRLGDLDGKLYSHDEAYTALHAAGYTGSDAINGIWNGRVITRENIQEFLGPSEEKDIFDTLSVLARSQPHESPLYFIFAHYWMRLFGSSSAAMRGLAVLFSLLAIPAMFWLCLELFHSHTTALLSMALLALSPFNILYAQDARPYSLWASITVLSSATFLCALRENKKLVWGIYTLSLAIGFYSHQLFVLIAIAHGCYVLIVKEARANRSSQKYIVSSLLGLLLFTPWLFQIIIRWKQVTRGLDWANIQIPWWQYIQRWVLIFSSPFLDLQWRQGIVLTYMLRAAVLLLIAYALYFLFSSTPQRVWIFIFLLIGVTTFPFILSGILRGGIVSVQGRYFIPVNIIVIPVVAHLLAEKLSIARTPAPIKWPIFAAILLVAQIGSILNIFRAETWWTKNLSSNSPQIVHILNDASRPLFIVYGMAPTDLGDVLALSFMVDRDVQFRLYKDMDSVDLSGNLTEVYWFHNTFTKLTGSGEYYQNTEVVPGRLWRISEQTK